MSGWMMKRVDKNQLGYFHKGWRRLKVRHKLALIFLPIPLFAVVLIGALWYRNALHAVNKTLEEQTSVLAQNAGLRVEDFFHERKLEITAVARLSWLENFFRESPAPEAGKQLEKFAENFKTLLAYLDGGYFQITCFDFRQQPLAKIQLTSFFSQHELPAHFETLYFDAQDKIGMKELAALPADEIHISEVKSIRGVKALVLGIAIFEAQSARRIGAMTFKLPISRVAEKTMMSYGLGAESRVMLVDKSGDLIYHPDRKKINQNIRAAMPYLGHIVDLILRLKKGTAGYRDENHAAWIVSYTPVKAVQWITGVASPVAPFIQSTERAGLMGIAITVSVAGLLLFLINRLSQSLVRDLSEVTEGAKAIAAGDLNRQLPVRSGDEIGELAADFNIMAADLKQLMRERQANETLIAVGKFSAALAHDLRNPVEGLKLLSRELCKRVGQKQQEYEIADAIAQSVERLSSLVSQSLDFARLNQPVFAETDLAVLADEVLQDFRFGEVELQKEYAHDLPLVKVDAAQIKRVLANLLWNALEACFSKSDSRRGQISLKLQASGEKLRLEVADTGPGIPAEIREKIFDPFFSTKPGGHGLGLALARQIITNHGGTIAFASEMGQGTRFVIELPIAK